MSSQSITRRTDRHAYVRADTFVGTTVIDGLFTDVAPLIPVLLAATDGAMAYNSANDMIDITGGTRQTIAQPLMIAQGERVRIWETLGGDYEFVREAAISASAQHTFTQPGHPFGAFTVPIPVRSDGAGAVVLANTADADNTAVSHIIAIDGDDLTLTGDFRTVTAHGYTPGDHYYVQDDGSYGLTPGTWDQPAFYAWSNDVLQILDARPLNFTGTATAVPATPTVDTALPILTV